MVGRNDSCPCGSGKKYKKCCALKSETSSDQLVDEELERITLGFYENAIGSPSDIAELERYEREWRSKLGKYMSLEEIDAAVAEYFLYVARRDLWTRYLMKTLNSSIRPATRTVLETWRNPIVLFGKVTTVKEDHFLVEEVLGHETYYVELEPGMSVEKDLLVFGVVLVDKRLRENGIHLLGGLTFIHDHNGMFTQQIEAMAEASGQSNSHEFFKVHMVDIHKAIVEREINGVDDLVERELLPLQQEVVSVLVDQLHDLDAPPQIIELSQMIAVTYLLTEKPNFRKSEVIAAAVFKATYEYGLLGLYDFSQAEIAKLFDVTTSSMKKHADRLNGIMDVIAKEFIENEVSASEFAYPVGTDPWVTERLNWEMYCRMSKVNFETLEEAQAYMEASMNEPFKPQGKKQQAQAIAYDAYDAEEEEERIRLAEKAYTLDRENVDAILLMAEMTDLENEAERLYQTAIRLGEAQFDDEPEIPWGLVTNRPYMRAIFAYGIWLFDEERYTESVKCFTQLLEMNPEDHQGAAVLAMASSIHNEDYDKASQLLEQLDVYDDEHAPYLYLKWFLAQMTLDPESLEVSRLFEDALDSNPYVGGFFLDDVPDTLYPRRDNISPGSLREAFYIWSLL